MDKGLAVQTMKTSVRIPSNHAKPRFIGACQCNLSSRGVDSGGPRGFADQPSVAEMTNSGFSERPCIKKYGGGAGEMAQWVKALVAFAEDLGSVGSQHPHQGAQLSIIPEDMTPSSGFLEYCMPMEALPTLQAK